MNFCVARVETRTRASVAKFERHIERKNESYENMNVDLSRTPMNVCYKSCGNLTYNEWLDEMIAAGKVSLKGLKPDAKIFDEMILDVNTDYFEKNGGYDYARRFYEEAYRFAEKLYGRENVLSAVMHADELNTAVTEKCGRPIYHYHLHVMALPVVEKEVRWTKRCKDPALVGTVKEVIHQVSHSKKWRSEKALDEDGSPILNSKGKPIYHASYSVLQDKFFEHMKDAGFQGFERGERGSTAENLSVLDYKIKKDQEKLTELSDRIASEELRFGDHHKAYQALQDIEHAGKKNLRGNYTVSLENYKHLTTLAKQTYWATSKAEEMQRERGNSGRRYWALEEEIESLKQELAELKETCKPYLEALKIAPKAVKRFIDSILERFRKQQKDIFYKSEPQPLKHEDHNKPER